MIQSVRFACSVICGASAGRCLRTSSAVAPAIRAMVRRSVAENAYDPTNSVRDPFGGVATRRNAYQQRETPERVVHGSS